MTWSGAENGALRVRLAEAPPAIRRLMLVDDIMARLRDALALEDDAAIGPDDRFKDLGIDSRRALEMKEDLEEALGHPLQTTLMFDYPTPDRLAGFIIDAVGLAEAAPDAAPDTASDAASDADAAGDDPGAALRRMLEKYDL